MINGDVTSFVEGIGFGETSAFVYNEEVYVIQGYCQDEVRYLFLDRVEPKADDLLWSSSLDDGEYPVDEFLDAPLFNGKTFMDIEDQVEWIEVPTE